MQIHVVTEGRERSARRRVVGAERRDHAGAHLHLHERNLGGREASQGVRRLGELDRHVAGIEAEPEMTVERDRALGSRSPREHGEPRDRVSREEVIAEERDRIRHRLEYAPGLRLEPETDAPSGLRLERDQAPRAAASLRDRRAVGRRPGARPERAGHRTDTAVEAGLRRQQSARIVARRSLYASRRSSRQSGS